MLTPQATHFIPGPTGKLEAIISEPSVPFTKAIVICHPNPLFAGTMHNKVAHTIARAAAKLNYLTVRFNFRGVGKSEGTHDYGKGETEDTLAVMQWVQENFKDISLSLAGFSFGGFVAANAASRMPVETLITVAPSAENFDFNQLGPINCPWLIIQGEADEIIPPHYIYDFVATRKPTPTLIRLPNVTHFFHGHLTLLQTIIMDYLEKL